MSDLKLRNSEDVSLVQDLITLPHLHEPAILHSLSERFVEGQIYTFTGKQCVYRDDDDDDVMMEYILPRTYMSMLQVPF